MANSTFMNRSFPSWATAIILALLGVPVASATAQEKDPKDRSSAAIFDSKIAPLLAGRCLECHNTSSRKGGLDLSRLQSARAGGESGKVIVPGMPDESLLWQHVRDEEMPPKHPLPEAEKQLLRRWIATGAKWGTDPIDPFRLTTNSRAGYDWWSLQPLRSPRLPDIGHDVHDAARNGIDSFILAKLNERALRPASPADRRVLIRRLSFDLLGLPPTPDQVHGFVQDSGPDAYERLTDRMLASPDYGIRWGRHWLDIARFGESQGFERDRLRPHSWPYRDWVIQALNEDMPYDEFARQQLAGDVLRPGDALATTATGFLVAGPWDEVGQAQQSAVMRAVVRQDELEDLASVVGQTFLGLTINCARCHDHKFDPILQKEYYQLTAALAGVRHGERDVIRSQDARRRDELTKQIRGREAMLAAIEATVRNRLLAQSKSKEIELPPTVQPVARWNFDQDLKDQVGTAHAEQHPDAKFLSGRLVLDQAKGYAATHPVKFDLREKTLEAWVKLEDFEQRGGSAITVQNTAGNQFDAIVFGEREPRRWMAGSNGFVRTSSFQGPQESRAHEQFVQVAIAYHADGTIAGYRDGRPYGKPYKSAGLATYKSGQWMLLFGLRHGGPEPNRQLRGLLETAQLYDRALTPEEVHASFVNEAAGITHDKILASLTAEERSRHEALAGEISRLQGERARHLPYPVYTVSPRQPEVVHFLHRGNPVSKGEVVAAGGVASITGLKADFGLATDATDADRRRALVNWITDPRNPLFRRVIVNRLWHYHFGVGLVDTPSDFGFNAGRPTHPMLIDHLATRWNSETGVLPSMNLKPMHRLIVTSATYRQSSAANAAAIKIDADNRLLWRKSPQRLEAEVLRDTTLMITGQLNRRMGGPGYRDFDTFINNTQFYTMKDVDGPQYNRRSIYRTWIRSGRSPFLDTFDCPDPSTKAPKRAVTVTPLQALTLMNSAFMMRIADRFAARLRAEAPQDEQAQLRQAFNLAYGRMPHKEELALTERFKKDHGLSALCRVLLNGNELLYID